MVENCYKGHWRDQNKILVKSRQNVQFRAMQLKIHKQTSCQVYFNNNRIQTSNNIKKIIDLVPSISMVKREPPNITDLSKIKQRTRT